MQGVFFIQKRTFWSYFFYNFGLALISAEIQQKNFYGHRYRYNVHVLNLSQSPLSWLDPGAYGTLGVGGGFAIGAATVDPTRPIFIIYGDGSAGYSLIEMDTAKRNGTIYYYYIGLIKNP